MFELLEPPGACGFSAFGFVVEFEASPHVMEQRGLVIELFRACCLGLAAFGPG